ILFGNRLPETRPTSSGFKFRVRRKKGITAANAPINAMFVIVPVLACERAFGTGASGDFVFLRRQLLPPFGVRLLHLFHFNNSFSLTRVGKLDQSDDLPPFRPKRQASASSDREPRLQERPASHSY